ncbi:MAG: efflux RND transporter periplasmic adaptor subunit [Kiritimatiellaeota bacterium]|nr:efflux RND transporter periplasmic adaptor subunit [Kiritimatiellota bacterium]
MHDTGARESCGGATCVGALRLALPVLLVLLLGGCGGRREQLPAGTARVTTGPLSVWAVYDGKLDSRVVFTIMSSLGGQATLVHLLPEGVRVQRGAPIARLDSSRIEKNLVKLQGQYAMAKSEFESIKLADWPLKIADLERQVSEARSSWATEQQYLDDNRALLKEDLITPQEIKQQELKAAQARGKTAQLENQLTLTRQYLQPLAVEQARAKLAAVEQELNLEKLALQACTLTAPADGLLGYLPTYLGNEYRTVRVGDSIFMNQPFLVIPDMSNLVVHCYVPESELARVQPGAAVRLEPLAYPSLAFDGTVESVGSTAQTRTEKPAWQKYFHVLIALRTGDERLRSGMSVTARILAYAQKKAVLLPRPAVRWQGRAPWVRLQTGAGVAVSRPVQVGWGDDRHVEILAGLQPGDVVVLEE